ncbi:RNA polymerase II elongation factor ELL-like [Corythoichthys intestinalis]|uniref:RNA polymerase II elongation factor ELL-like n=1 Tax=Corythoichthys intestinalis TaxID=161448 RepID=UPI0025A5DEE2|nr:RNA polymerase II elongation factor ELL-like [Corythoichthys intestinalis]XP_061796811.1 RNA polymerase II elongation factor ELL-like [Nerophis lumbriciformis]
MASLGQDRRYGLSCGKNNSSNNKHGLNRTLYHVKLTDTAIRALESYQNLKANLPNEPSICFEGNQGYIKLPAPTVESPNAFRIFSFYLSSDCKDQPQASFDCIHQYVSSDGCEQLEGQGVIQDKITVCATEDSYQMTRERMSQVEKDSWSRSAIEIKPGATHPSKSVKLHKKAPVLSASDSSVCRAPAPSRWSGSLASAHHKSLRERIIHLLALKSYRKPELLLWLERERVVTRDKAELSAILDEVAKVNPKDSSYLLKDDFYKYVRKDWPGYNEEERQLVSRLLSRKLQPHVRGTSRNPQATIEKPCEDRTLQHSLTKNPIVKRTVSTDCLQALSAKRQRQSDHTTQEQPAINGLLNNKEAPTITSPTLPKKTDFQGTNNTIGSYHGTYQHDSPHKVSNNSDISETDLRRTKAMSHEALQAESECAQQQRKKKSKKHKDKERERLKDHQDKRWSDDSPDLKSDPDKLGNCDITKDMDSVEKPDYVRTYVRITSIEQRQQYQEDFGAEYDEYKDLHTRIAAVTQMFVQLGSKIKSMAPGTKEHKVMEDQILEKYNKYRKKFPDYQEEKKRCEYLHQKLSFIKQLIMDYDVSRTSS